MLNRMNVSQKLSCSTPGIPAKPLIANALLPEAASMCIAGKDTTKAAGPAHPAAPAASTP